MRVVSFDPYRLMKVAVKSCLAGVAAVHCHRAEVAVAGALAGVAAAAVALGVAELLGVLVRLGPVRWWPSAGAVIDVVPESGKEIAIRLFGSTTRSPCSSEPGSCSPDRGGPRAAA